MSECECRAAGHVLGNAIIVQSSGANKTLQYTDKVVSSVQYIYTAMITSPNLASRSRHVYIIYYNIRQEAVLSIFIKTMCSVYMRES